MNDQFFEELEKLCKEIQYKIDQIDEELNNLKGFVFIVILMILTHPLFFR